jgi:diguanylate cyclase (GGDEF)-like protein
MKEISTAVRSLEDAERRIARLSRDYAILRAINAAIVRIRDRDELFDEACRVVVLHGGFRMAWIGVIGASPADPIVVLAHAGDERNFLSRVPVILDGSVPGGRGVTAAAITGNRSAVDNDIEGNRVLGVVRDECLARGYRSALALPLRVDGNPIGALVIYASEPGYFTPEEVRLLEEFAADVTLGMAFISKFREVEYLAFHDPLTGLANRARFLQRIAAHAGDDSRRHASFAVMLLDLERFHSINDTYGPAAGDEVLRTVTTRLRAACSADEPPARIGADAFGVLLPGTHGVDETRQRIERIFVQTFAAPFAVADASLLITAKAGVALYPDDGGDTETLFQNAEAARQIANDAPEPFVFYARDMNAMHARSLATENRLRHGIANGQFVVHYQPKVDAVTRGIVGAEALLRWNDPDQGLVSTQQFVTLLEETGLIVDTGRFVLQRVSEDIARWRSRGLAPPRIAVNVSAVQLRSGGFLREFCDLVSRAGADLAGLDVEITESALLADLPDTVLQLKQLRGLGVDIAIDDFGTGYSSLSYLARLPVTTLKIDRTFLHDMPGSAERKTIVASIISLAHALHFKVVAEGVENEAQAALLRELSCDQMQGFLFHEVLPRERFEALLPRA